VDLPEGGSALLIPGVIHSGFDPQAERSSRIAETEFTLSLSA